MFGQGRDRGDAAINAASRDPINCQAPPTYRPLKHLHQHGLLIRM